ncbi:MAG TPA: hypothetical protein VMS75_00300 [Terriglobales bacterium]|nr:hypothetical protein [Terriglobales bacterium]
MQRAGAPSATRPLARSRTARKGGPDMIKIWLWAVFAIAVFLYFILFA